MKIGKTITVTTRKAWRAWLRKNHQSAEEIWLVYHKKNSGKPRIEYNAAVEEALCYGWIDGIVKGIDEDRYAQRFTPRKPRSPWSAMNKERVRRLIRSGRMTKAGLAAYRRPHANPESHSGTTIPPDILAALQRDPDVYKWFRKLPLSYRRIRIGWITSARSRPVVFRQRLRHFLRMTARRKQYGMVR